MSLRNTNSKPINCRKHLGRYVDRVSVRKFNTISTPSTERDCLRQIEGAFIMVEPVFKSRIGVLFTIFETKSGFRGFHLAQQMYGFVFGPKSNNYQNIDTCIYLYIGEMPNNFSAKTERAFKSTCFLRPPF